MWAVYRMAVSLVAGFVLGIVFSIWAISTGWIAPTPGDNTPLSVMASDSWGRFPTSPKVELLDNGRELRLLDDFAYIDPRGKTWSAPKGIVVNGATIPPEFWSIIGGPLEGEYRNASIVHDQACMRMDEPWEDVHLMFYQACRCGGLSEYKAKLMYAAVYQFGPRWEIQPNVVEKTAIGPDGKERLANVRRPAKVTRSTRGMKTADRQKLEKFIQERSPSLEDLRKLDPKTL